MSPSKLYPLVFALAVLFTSCHSDRYIDAIPKKVSALAAIDVPRTAAQLQVDADSLMTAITGIEQPGEHGIDLDAPLYVFETADGNFGLCAKMNDSDDFTDYITALSAHSPSSQEGVPAGRGRSARGDLQSPRRATKPQERRGCTFSFYQGKWMMGWTSDALLVIGPLVESQLTATQQQMATLLKQDKDKGVRSGRLFDRLPSLKADTTAALIAQADVLPESVAALFTMGTPKDSEPSQVLITGAMTSADRQTRISGTTFSYNKTINKALAEARKQLRPIDMKQVVDLDATALVHVFFNIEGKTYLPFIQSNPALQSLLLVSNAAIDLDNIIRSIDGTCHLQVNGMPGSGGGMMLTAPLAHTQWLADVPYWQQSVPSGARLTEQTTPDERQKGAHHYLLTTEKDGEQGPTTQRIYFGINPGNRFYIGTQAPAHGNLQPVSTRGDLQSPRTTAPAHGNLQSVPAARGDLQSPRTTPPSHWPTITDSGIAILLDLKALRNQPSSIESNLLDQWLRPLFGHSHTLIYIVGD